MKHYTSVKIRSIKIEREVGRFRLQAVLPPPPAAAAETAVPVLGHPFLEIVQDFVAEGIGILAPMPRWSTAERLGRYRSFGTFGGVRPAVDRRRFVTSCYQLQREQAVQPAHCNDPLPSDAADTGPSGVLTASGPQRPA